MARYGSFLYRRNGRYYARLRVPRALLFAYGRTHLRASLGTSDYDLARVRVHETVLSWKRDFALLEMAWDPLQLTAGSPLLAGEGFVTVESAARECGLSTQELLREVLNRRIELRLSARGWFGTEMSADALDFESDGAFNVDCADGLPQDLISGDLYLRRDELVLAVASGIYEGCLLANEGHVLSVCRDLSPDDLRSDIDRLAFKLPPIAPFDVADGLIAVDAALDRKRQQPDRPQPKRGTSFAA